MLLICLQIDIGNTIPNDFGQQLHGIDLCLEIETKCDKGCKATFCATIINNELNVAALSTIGMSFDDILIYAEENDSTQTNLTESDHTNVETTRAYGNPYLRTLKINE